MVDHLHRDLVNFSSLLVMGTRFPRKGEPTELLELTNLPGGVGKLASQIMQASLV